MSAAAEVHPLLLAEVNLSGKYNPPTYEDARIPVYGFLILSGDHVALVDTGVGDGNDYIERQFEPTRPSLINALARHDVALGDVTLLINSHLHFDHCGSNRLFPQIPVYVQADELRAATAPKYTVAEWFDFEGADLRAITGDHTLAPGIRLIATPGHTPGHQSVLVGAGEDAVLIAAQAAFNPDEFARGGDPDVQSHEGLGDVYLESLAKLRSHGASRMLFSHG